MGSSPRHTRRTFIPQTLLSGVAEREDDIWPVLSRPPLLPREPELGNPGHPATKSSLLLKHLPRLIKVTAPRRAVELTCLAAQSHSDLVGSSPWVSPTPSSSAADSWLPPSRHPALCNLPRGRRMKTLSAARVMALLCLGKHSQSQRGEGNGPVHLS